MSFFSFRDACVDGVDRLTNRRCHCSNHTLLWKSLYQLLDCFVLYWYQYYPVVFLFLFLPGFTGWTGSSGPKGQAGPTGIPGSTGATGFEGLTGAPGDTGFSGPAGEQGLAGATGATGESGQKGFQGNIGSPGSPGKFYTFVSWFVNVLLYCLMFAATY